MKHVEMIWGRVLTGGVVVDCGVEPPPAVLVGLLPGTLMYPHNPSLVFPHKSSGYPTQGVLQSLTEVVSPGWTLEHQQLAPWRTAKAAVEQNS
jgi:hypothetical protein